LAFQRAPAVNKLLIVVDHIEWLFLFTGHADRLSFLQTLQTFTEALPVTVLFTIRPEWEAAVSELMPAWRWVLNDGLVLNPLPASELRRMALRNLIAGKDSEAILTLLDDLAVAPGSTSVFSQWAEKKFRLADVGDPETAVSEALEQVLYRSTAFERNLLLSNLSRLVSVR
ncbi:MAG: hypothetical protein H7Y20_08190, partial [Bryobacteraceae bacterium]|nr:hypothetical protein [Bryobacteraceae bacterium]